MQFGTKPVKPIMIFFAWQTRYPKTNRDAIRKALKSATAHLKQELSSQKIGFKVHEATTEEAGSPNIPKTILKKIEASDVFIGDLTTIMKQRTPTRRASPNPNVVFELGFAVAHLGWRRVIMVFNKAFGPLEDLPFDIDRQRVSSYKLREVVDANRAVDVSNLKSILINALRNIVTANPTRPAELKGLSVQQIHRERDKEALTWLLSTVSWTVIDRQLEEGPRILRDRTCDFWEYFRSVFSDTRFHLYDSSLRTKVNRFYQLWGKIVSYDRFYRALKRRDFVFDAPGDVFPTREHEHAWGELMRIYPLLGDAKEALIGEIRDKFVELDLVRLSDVAWKNHVAIEKMVANNLEQ
jgi:hypothetical protein